MEEKKRMVPQLRFPGFTDDWEQRKLGDVAEEFQSGKFISAANIEETGEYPVYGGNGLRGYCNTYNHDGDFALIGRQGALCGNMNFSRGKAYFTEHAVVVKANALSNTRFLYYLLDKMNLGQYSDQSAQPGLAVGKLVKLENMFPSKQEQERIGEFLEDLDNLITIHQRKLEVIKEYKKGMLQKMFPKNGAAVPEVRFPGFTDDWEQRKFGELYEKVTEKNDLSFGSDRIISVANMYFKPDAKASDDDYMKTYNVMRLGDIAFEGNKSKHFAHGRFVENTIGDGIVSHVFDVFRPIAEYDLFFWKYLINNEYVMGRIMTRCTKSSTMMTNLVANDFLNEKITVPTIDEQRRIGATLNDLDNLITLHQSKLDKLKDYKKGLLQQMFV